MRTRFPGSRRSLEQTAHLHSCRVTHLGGDRLQPFQFLDVPLLSILTIFSLGVCYRRRATYSSCPDSGCTGLVSKKNQSSSDKTTTCSWCCVLCTTLKVHVMDQKEADLQELCERVFREKDAAKLAALVDELHGTLDARANRIRLSTQLLLSPGRGRRDYAEQSVAIRSAGAAVNFAKIENRGRETTVKPRATSDLKIDRLIKTASAVICVALHCFVPLRFLIRKSREVHSPEIAPSTKNFRSSGKPLAHLPARSEIT